MYGIEGFIRVNLNLSKHRTPDIISSITGI